MPNTPFQSDDLDAADEQQLVTLLDEFEQAIRDRQQPQIESYLSRVNDKLRGPLLYDLVRLEQELLGPDFKPTIKQYQTRFPSDETLLSAALPPDALSVDADTETTMLWDRTNVQIGQVPDPQHSQVAETAELLRRRLRMAALVVVVGMSVFLIRAVFFPGSHLFWLRVAVLVTALFCFWRLSIARTQMIGLWRWLELVLLVAVGTQTATLQVVRMTRSAALGDAVDVNLAMLFGFATWSVVNMVYAILIPNSWRRAAVILLPTAAVPLVVTLLLMLGDATIASVIRVDWMHAASLLTFLASGAAIAGTVTVHSLRMQLFAARRFGQYRLTERLGRGGMGEVYLAEHQLLKRPSAIKLIRPGYDTDAEAVARFEREVQATAALSHWNTVEIFDYGRTDDGTFYYVMEYLEGRSLQQLIDQYGPMPPARVLYFLRQLCDVLVEAHHAGMIHQDIKPANIFAAQCGSRYDVAKLLDFGLVQEVAATKDFPTTSTNDAPRIVGTPRFMSPEQARGSKQRDIRSDIYSLGATAYYLVTGEPVFKRSTVSKVLVAHLRDDVIPPSQFCSDLPEDLEAIILKCLSKKLKDRFNTAQELAGALAQCDCVDGWSAEQAARWWAKVVVSNQVV